MKYRKLEDNELIQAGDRYTTSWHAHPDGLHDGHSFVGLAAGGPGGIWSGNWRRPTTDNWISFEDRKPTKDDSLKGQVAIKYQNGSLGMARVKDIDDGNFTPTRNTYWMASNFVPREPDRVIVNGYEVVPQKNGNVKVGCQTVSSQDFEEIVRQRADAMK